MTSTLLPTPEALLKPQVVEGVPESINHRKQVAKKYYDKTAQPLPELQIGEQVRIQPKQRGLEWRLGVCRQKVGPRSYLIETNTGQIWRRNRRFLRSSSESPMSAHTAPRSIPGPSNRDDGENAPQPSEEGKRRSPSYADITAAAPEKPDGATQRAGHLERRQQIVRYPSNRANRAAADLRGPGAISKCPRGSRNLCVNKTVHKKLLIK